MNNKGFTLIELLAVITLIGIVIGIAIPSVSFINKSIKDKMLESKKDFIIDAAIIYGEDNEEEIMDSNKTYNNFACISIYVKDLIPDYLDKDDEVGIINPIDNTYLDDKEIIIYHDNQIKAALDMDNNIDCN